MDVSNEMIKLAKRKRIKNTTFYCGVLEEINDIHQRHGDISVVIMFEVIEHLSKPNKLLKNIYNLLKKGGHIVITTPNFYSCNRRLKKLFHTFVLEKLHLKPWDYLSQEHFQEFTPNSLLSLLLENRFKIIKCTGIGLLPFPLLLNKIIPIQSIHDCNATLGQVIPKLSSNIVMVGQK